MHSKTIKHWFFLFLYLPILLQASWEDLFSEDDDPGLFHHVQVISGHLNFSLQDDIVQGAIPIPLMRTYSSGGALEKDPKDNDLLLRKLHKGWMMQGGWSFLSHTNLFLMPGKERKKFKAYLAEPGGGVITYAYSHREDKRFLFFKPIGSFPSLSGNLGAKNNPQNNLLRLDLKKGIALLFLPDGGTREYHGSDFSNDKEFDPRNQCYYRLDKEVLPSKHQVHYEYDKRLHLTRIRSTSPTGDKTYATVNLTLSTSPLRLRARTSDGKEFYYQSLEADDREYQYRMESPNSPLEIAGFGPSRKGIGLVTVGNGINTNIDEFDQMNKSVRDVVGGTLIVSLHNPTEGLVKDAYRTLKERSGVNTPAVCRTRQFMATISEALYKVNPNVLWFYLAHSENGVISKRAIEGLSTEHKSLLQKDLYLYAAGPADPIPKDYGKSVINAYSTKDYVTKGFAKPYLQDENYDIRFLKCESPRSERILWEADHGFLAPTYMGGWSNNIYELRDDFVFYQGGSSEKTR